MEINLIVYHSGGYKEQNETTWSEFEASMKQLVKQSKGKYIQYRKDGTFVTE